jgi:hypothetical protein
MNTQAWEGDLEITILDMSGRKLQQYHLAALNTSQIELSFNKPAVGLYWVELREGSKVERQRLVIQ